MKFLEEAKVFIEVILKWIYSFLGFFLFFFMFGVKEISFLEKILFIPFPSHNSFTVIVFQNITKNLISPEIELIVTSPLEAFWAQISIAFFLSIIITFPFLIYKILKYVFPALNKKEKSAILKTIFPFSILFFLGCLFSYYLVIPSTIDLLYAYYAKTIGVKTYFSLKEFVPLVFALSFGIGVIFTVPVFMTILSSLGLVNPTFWKNNWKYSFLFFLIFSAIITPDGSGITMIFLVIPLTFLYFLGYAISKKVFKEKRLLK